MSLSTSDRGSRPDDRDRVLALLRRYGWNATSFQILEPGFRYWFDDGDSACVGYVDTGRAWVAAGSPLAPTERLAEACTKFAAAAAAAGRRACWFGAESRFLAASGWPGLRIGDQPSWDPAAWDAGVRASKNLREQLRRARAKGVVVRRATADELLPEHPTRVQLDALVARWLGARTLAPMGFLVQVHPFALPDERRCFVAERDGRVVALLAAIPIYARRGWFFEDFLRDPDAPNGTIELLIDAGMRAAAAEGIAYATLGLAPLSGDVGPWLRAARKLGKPLYDFEGLRAFKAKLAPTAWDPIYLAHARGRSALVATVDALTAFARGGLLRFGIETLLRGPAIVVRALAVLLVAWTVMLALPIAAPFFPSPAWQYGWVAFDVALAIALFAVSARWKQPLGDAVALAITFDALATDVEAVAYNLPHARNIVDTIVTVVAIAAPTVAAVLIWNARARRAL
jgi:lysylphosphatidylglycerol synthetase-like protein (DUF2156 family)